LLATIVNGGGKNIEILKQFQLWISVNLDFSWIGLCDV